MHRNAPAAARSTAHELYACAPSSTQEAFNARIVSWLRGVEPLAPSPDSDMAFRTVRAKGRQAKPYSRPEGQRHPSHGSASTEEVAVTGLRDTRQNILDLRSAARIDRSMRSLPHPHENPLVTRCSEDLQEEYARIVLLYNTLEEQRQQSELRWQHRPTIRTLQEITNLEKSCQQVINAAQYVVDFAYSLRIDIDFERIFLRYRSPPVKIGTSSTGVHSQPSCKGDAQTRIYSPQPVKSINISQQGPLRT
ncbi:hypothetical protein BDN70DRAFT_875233 [Pholiota conissans]|uniref:Uncharacterized protein n=1 Tax=Pholiota conissans TaxID=109636 RepID=A0A9P5Z733_9AGAR|nr:hypothetical protein BDN70DRAFT_875233 [Pholiota conissans]